MCVEAEEAMSEAMQACALDVHSRGRPNLAALLNAHLMHMLAWLLTLLLLLQHTLCPPSITLIQGLSITH